MSTDVVMIIGSDARYFEPLQGAARSIRDTPQGQRVLLGVFDLGLLPEQRRWLVCVVRSSRGRILSWTPVLRHSRRTAHAR
jgi:hypothetical protein